jgi:predicted transcriptional regulator
MDLRPAVRREEGFRMARSKRATKGKAAVVAESEVEAAPPEAVAPKARATRASEESGMVGLLGRTGMPKGIARTLAVLSSAQDWLTSKDIERETGLRQPEVSRAVRDLLDKGWITKDSLKLGTKGRPVYTYKMAVDLKRVYLEMRDGESVRIASIKDNLEAIKAAWGV